MLRKVVSGIMAKLSWLCPNVLPDLFHDADDAKRKAAQRHLLVQRIDVRKELVHQVLADHRRRARCAGSRSR